MSKDIRRPTDRLCLRLPVFGPFLVAVLVAVGLLSAAQPGHAAETAAAGSGSSRRPGWTTSHIEGTPEPPLPYTVERIYGTLSFETPVDWAQLPGSNWLYVLELTGKLYAFDGSRSDPEPVLVFDSARDIAEHHRSYGIVFHPRAADNREVFLSWVVEGELVPDGTHVSRFRLTDEQPPRLVPDSRQDIITWHSGGHNGGCLKFGPDGNLYVSAGDGVGPFPPDTEEVGQNVGDLRSKILRIDVDRPSGPDRLYSTPSDNPFVDRAEARPEVWAYGFRNPWKMSFSPVNGDLFAGDVGWELWEMVFRVERGGNYGWSVMEGRQPIRSDVPRGPTPILPPLVDHHHIEARSVTGGFVYRGSRLPELQGAYIYGDYVTGKIWGLRNEGNTVTWHQELADSPLAIITFGEDQEGELVVVDYAGGLYRLSPNARRGLDSAFPRKLSETGLFADVIRQKPAAGVIEYHINAQPWMEGASARRFVALPGTGSIETVPNREMWKYPQGTVFAKTIMLAVSATAESRPQTPLEPAHGHPVPDAPSPRMIETQILHFDGEQWYPYTYLWNDGQTDAELVAATGTERTLTVPAVTGGGTERLSWRLHSRSECSTCHTNRGGFTLGFYPENLRRPLTQTASRGPGHAPLGLSLRQPQGGETTTTDVRLAVGLTSGPEGDQLAALVDLGVFAKAFPDRQLEGEIVDPYDDSADLELRARSYLMVNCAHCHRRGGGGTAPLDIPLDVPLPQTHAVDELPTQGAFNIPQARVLAPRDPYRSVLYYRMSTIGRGHMPHLGARRIDEQGRRLIYDWISQLPVEAGGGPDLELPRSVRELADRETADMQRLTDQPGLDRILAAEIVSRLLTTTTGALRLLQGVDTAALPEAIVLLATTQGSQHADPIIRGLFERFLPEERRTKRLGTQVHPEAILALPGDSVRGQALFVDGVGIQCRNCHQVGTAGKSVGPRLDDIGARYSRTQLLEHILDPSRRIDTPWVNYTLVTTGGRVLTGLLVQRTGESVTLRDPQGQDHGIATSEIEELLAQQKSLMPELLFQDMTAEQLADLLAFLVILRGEEGGATQ